MKDVAGSDETRETIGRIFWFEDGQMSYEDVGADMGLSEDESLAVGELMRAIRDSLEPDEVARLARLLREEGRMAEDIARYVMLHLVAEYQSRLQRGVEKHGVSLMASDHIRIETGEDGKPVPALDLGEERAAGALADLAGAVGGYLGETLDPDGQSPLGDAPEETGWRLVAEAVYAQALLVRVIASPEAGTYREALAEDLDGEDALSYLRDRRRRHYRAVAQSYARHYVDALDASGLHPQQLEALVGLSPPGRAEAVPVPTLRDGHFATAAALVWQRTREAVARGAGAFGRVEGSPWPTADITAPSKKVRGHAVLMPPRFDGGAYMPPDEAEAWASVMWRQREELSDLDADVLDALCAVWLAQAKDPRDSALATVDELLRMRGVKPKLGGGGRRGGYEAAQREAVMRALTRLENVWLTISEMEVYETREGSKRTKAKKMAAQSRAFVLTDRVGQMRLDGGMEVERFRFRPGDVFALYLGGAGRQTALLSAAALAYDPYREVWEKRLGKYLSWRWKAGARSGHWQPHKVATLLERAGQEVNHPRPLRTRERLEKALDRLHRDGAVAGWQYDRFHDRLEDTRQGWVERWLASTIIIEPPDVIKETPGGRSPSLAPAREPGEDGEIPAGEEFAGARITVSGEAPSAPGRPTDAEGDKLVERVARRRKETKLSQLRLAERLGVSQALVSRVERGKERPSAALRERMRAFLRETDPKT